MARTRKGAKPPGFEYWTARPGNKYGGTPGRATKRYTAKAERQQGRSAARDTVDGL